MPRTWIEERVDFAAIAARIAAIRPPTLTLEDVVTRLRPQLAAARKRGVTWTQLADGLRDEGFPIGARPLQSLVEEGTRTDDAQETAPAPPRQPDDAAS